MHYDILTFHWDEINISRNIACLAHTKTRVSAKILSLYKNNRSVFDHLKSVISLKITKHMSYSRENGIN